MLREVRTVLRVAEAQVALGVVQDTVFAPRDPARIAHALIGDRAQEAVLAIYLDCRRRVICHSYVAIGGGNFAMLQAKDVFTPALLCGAEGVILAHNHPGGDTTPSRDDWQVTERLTEAAKILGFSFYDHVIVGQSPDDSYSCANGQPLYSAS
jgi:DNA repair protein RadC